MSANIAAADKPAQNGKTVGDHDTPPVADIMVRWRAEGRRGAGQCRLMPGVTALIGPSGGGKTSLARFIAGIEKPDSGQIRIGGKTVFDSQQKLWVPARKRRIGYVPQDPTLFPHMSVEQNIRFGLKLSEARLGHLLTELDLKGMLNRRPARLSGGEARRVALARALASDPALLILDEPTAGLDALKRRQMLQLVATLARVTAVPTLFVTHALDDMLSIADRAILMSDLQILRSDTLDSVLDDPVTPEVLGLDDAGTLMSGTVTERGAGLISVNLGGARLRLPDHGDPLGQEMRLRIRARDVGITTGSTDGLSILNCLPAKVKRLTSRQGINHGNTGGEGTGPERTSETDVILSLTGTELTLKARLTHASVERLGLAPGMTCHAMIKAVAARGAIIAAVDLPPED